MTPRSHSVCTALALALLAAGCADLNIPDFNNPSIGDVRNNLKMWRVVTATQGLFVGTRVRTTTLNGYNSELGVFGRESYNFNSGDTRIINELLQPGPLDGSGPRFGGNLWAERYANIRNAGIVLNALAKLGTTPPVGMTSTEQAATRGFVKTMEALDFLLVIDTRDSLGAPVDVNHDITSGPAPFVKRDSVYAFIVGLLDSAVADLAVGGSSFPFGLPPGFSGFTTPTTFTKFNRALKARVEAYRATLLACRAPCWTRAKSALDSSFSSVGADTMLTDAVDSLGTAAMLARGAYYDSGTGSGDVTNGLNDPTGVSQVGHPSLRTQADTQATGQRDRRLLNKVRTATLSPVLGHTSDMVFNIYRSNAASVPIIRNEELILLRAEPEFGLCNQAGAAARINYIPAKSRRPVFPAGPHLAPPPPARTRPLQQRVYSLLFDGGHPWIEPRPDRRVLDPPARLPQRPPLRR